MPCHICRPTRWPTHHPQMPTRPHTASPHNSAAVLFPDLSDTEDESYVITRVPQPFTADFTLPSCRHSKRRKQNCETGHPRQCTFSAGAYTFAHSTGIQLSTDRFPLVVQLLTSVIRHTWCLPRCAVLFSHTQSNVQVQMHTGKNNASGYESMIIPCGRWQGGSLWIPNHDGAHALDAHSGPGTMQRITWPFIRFWPLLRHATTPWTSGDCTVLIGYMVKSLHRLMDDECHSLHYHGFRLP